MTTKVIIWGENVHEQTSDVVRAIYPDGMHRCIAAALNAAPGITAETATLRQPEHGLPEKRLAETDVLFWWGHAAHGEVAERVVGHAWRGMGLVALHSSHFAKVFLRLMESPCNLTWREAGERERLWLTAPGHPITAGLPDHFELENEEMYGEPFGVPESQETVFVSWFQGGEVFRSGLTYRQGAGKIFYFRPGHETYPTCHDANVQRVLRNAAKWAHGERRSRESAVNAPNRPVAE